MSATTRPRGICPVCGKNIRVKQDGRMFFHGYSVAIRNSGDRYANAGFCRGFNKPPVEAVSKP
ncbi:hypothetical protein Caci_3050 [Catenulispora acidiphila DSM 44928]|uniref:Uncharacterized protein n=1 Tax=Catenulispora acidiphila (strain DSM 44928 / JCM 14897 / NBRC 102108 / NRRL B-24433 / ID139908) TaxID=479433 RepID=C7Q4J0_CATAD|nr:hypothetical protein [Catenulispora acidiphila]ACU71959.1 hypothetical protein Caci_3050 [Catenulispora acidiphila DSM 44928]